MAEDAKRERVVPKPKPWTLEEYHALFGAGEDGHKRRERALTLAHEIRKFEIDLYWKRAAYFWTALAAAFAGYVLLVRGADDDSGEIRLMVACVGFILAASWYCVNRGSATWQRNWERHVDLLEDEITGPLYKSRIEYTKRPQYRFWDLWDAYPFSPSSINHILSVFITIVWAVIGVRDIANQDAWVGGRWVWSAAWILLMVGALIALGRWGLSKEVDWSEGFTLRMRRYGGGEGNAKRAEDLRAAGATSDPPSSTSRGSGWPFGYLLKFAEVTVTIVAFAAVLEWLQNRVTHDTILAVGFNGNILTVAHEEGQPWLRSFESPIKCAVRVPARRGVHDAFVVVGLDGTGNDKGAVWFLSAAGRELCVYRKPRWSPYAAVVPGWLVASMAAGSDSEGELLLVLLDDAEWYTASLSVLRPDWERRTLITPEGELAWGQVASGEPAGTLERKGRREKQLWHPGRLYRLHVLGDSVVIEGHNNDLDPGAFGRPEKEAVPIAFSIAVKSIGGQALPFAVNGVGRAEIRRYWAVPDSGVAIERFEAEGDRVVLWLSCSKVFYLGPDGRLLEHAAGSNYTCRDDLALVSLAEDGPFPTRSR